MAKTREQKEQEIEEYKDMLDDTPVAVLAEFEGLSVEEMQDVRAKAREQGISVKVVKNTLLNIAAEDMGYEDLELLKIGKMLALVTGGDDVVQAPKLVDQFRDETEKMEVYAGIYEEGVVGSDVINNLASIPGKQELLGNLVGSLSSPTQGLVSVLHGTIRDFANVVQAIKEKKE